jgi:hypothetical protein
MIKIRTILASAACLAALAGCNSASHSSASGALSSAAANPTYSAEVTQLESELLAAYKKDFSPAHPVVTMETAVREVFPQGNTGKIAAYAVQQLNPGMTASKQARQAWAQKVVTFGLGQGSGSPSASKS